MQKLVKTQKSTNNPLSSVGLIEENMELSHIHLAVRDHIYRCFRAPSHFSLFSVVKISKNCPFYILHQYTNGPPETYFSFPSIKLVRN